MNVKNVLSYQAILINSNMINKNGKRCVCTDKAGFVRPIVQSF